MSVFRYPYANIREGDTKRLQTESEEVNLKDKEKQHIVSGVSGGKNDAFLYEQVKINYPESFICTQKIATYIKTSYAFELSLDEQVFLTIHIQRLKDNLDK